MKRTFIEDKKKIWNHTTKRTENKEFKKQKTKTGLPNDFLLDLMH